MGQLIKSSQQMKIYFTRINLTIFGSIPHVLRASLPPPLSVPQHNDLAFWPMIALYILCPSHCRAPPAHCSLLPNLLILVFHHYLPMKFLSCLASSWCQMIPNIGPFTISKSLLTNSLTQKSIFLIIFSIPSSALLPATHLC